MDTEDTEWNDILRKRGIIGPKVKNETKEEEPEEVSSFERKLNDIQSEDDLLDLDESDEPILREYRRRRVAELEAKAMIPRFGDVREISASDYVDQVNNAGPNVQVVLLLYLSGIPECTLMSTIISQLAVRHPNTKFLKSIASQCVPNFPESSLPALFLYHNGCLKKQLIGRQTFGGKDIDLKTVEWLLSQNGSIISDLERESQNNDKKTKKFYEQY